MLKKYALNLLKTSALIAFSLTLLIGPQVPNILAIWKYFSGQ